MISTLAQYKIGCGPMSKEIINILTTYSTITPMMIIASRNQVDYQNGYVCDQKYLGTHLKNQNNILLCRDHCGPYFKDTDKNLTLGAAINECKKTIDHDLEAGFHLIHIDVSRAEYPFSVADELISYTLNLNPNILMEFGSEENTGVESAATNIDSQLEYCKQYNKNIKFFVSQTGSLAKEKQVGKFDVSYNLHVADKIHSAGFLFKEHNGDYLNVEDIMLRKQAKIDAINIAPQLGVIQTTVLHSLAKNTKEWEEFANCVYRGNKYHRWLSTAECSNYAEAVQVSGHYFFNTKEYALILNSIDQNLFYSILESKIIETLNTYKGI
jgi:hypothetical protein